MVPTSVRDELERIGLAVERSRSDFVKQRLPDVKARLVEQGDGNFPAPP
jgi:hypothetical protein